MAKYVIPPFMDFRNDEVKQALGGAFVMYIMEFNHSLDQEDLQNIWQNVNLNKIYRVYPYYQIHLVI